MNLQQLSRLFVSVVLFAACVVLALLAQAQSGGGQTPNPTSATPNGIFAAPGLKPRMPITGSWAGASRRLSAAP